MYAWSIALRCSSERFKLDKEKADELIYDISADGKVLCR